MPRKPMRRIAKIVGQLPAAARAQTAAHWGLPPKRVVSVDAPGMKIHQALWKLGLLRKLHLVDGTVIRASRPYPFVAVGIRDNKIYFVGPGERRMSRAHAWGRANTTREVRRIEYDARKGDPHQPVTWYHDHARPYPQLVVYSDHRPRYVGGKYKVRPEGIVD